MRLMTVMCLAVVTAPITLTAHAADDGPYRVLRVVKVGGDGGFDYVKTDATNRQLYITRHGKQPEVDVFDLDTLKPVGKIPNVGAAGALADPKSGHGFASSNPVTMFDARTLMKITDIPVASHPDDLMVDDYNDRLYLWSHTAPAGTVVDAVTGNVLGTIDLDGAVGEIGQRRRRPRICRIRQQRQHRRCRRQYDEGHRALPSAGQGRQLRRSGDG